MTHREQLLALLAEFGLTPATDERYRVQPGEVILAAKHGGVQGYEGFHISFRFDDEGNFTEAAVWE